MAVDVLVVGGSVAGVAAAEGLRRSGFSGSITIVDSEARLPYDKPPLSKAALTESWFPESALLRSAAHYESQGIDLRLGAAAERLNAPERSVTLESGETIVAGDVVLATGASPRRLTGPTDADGVHTLRTLDDALAIRRQLGSGRRLVVVGGGFVGAEVAATARQLGTDVTMVEARPLPFATVLGERVGAALVRSHARRGVRVIRGVPVSSVERSGDARTVVLADGRKLPADVVVVGLGVQPTTGWLKGSGVRVSNGVLCDGMGRTSIPHVYAAGDIASWWDAEAHLHTRHEHWTSAREQATVVAGAITGATAPAAVSAVPYFWSDQYDMRIQSFGNPSSHDECCLAWGSFEDERFVALYFRSGLLVGAVGVNAAREVRRYHAGVASRLPRATLDLPLKRLRPGVRA